MSERHTPGPWLLNKYGEPVDATGENIRAKGLALTNTDEAKANTRLIAAAPEMLAALQMIDKWFTPTGSSVRSRWDRIPSVERLAIVEAVRAAVAKAGGLS